MVESTNKESTLGHGIKVDTNNFIHENIGNIKDFYKISSCIGRGKFRFPSDFKFLCSPTHLCQLTITSLK